MVDIEGLNRIAGRPVEKLPLLCKPRTK